MKEKIHPKYSDIQITCACGNIIKTSSTMGKDLSVEICSSCHPFFTGKQKIIDSAGKVDKYNKRFAAGVASKAKKAEKAEKTEKH
ncbi:MAG: 50S ribosomal protein L31 [Deltaproteobacteria bacterium CG11_big_fil_rev_8_21_14_0_20_49_13]|nr:MAG: 50S ribosomal protein L31 [Deltaproteobacteria bacterium CG11_big_fil_rev_8_21_14_0_20_49_13]